MVLVKVTSHKDNMNRGGAVLITAPRFLAIPIISKVVVFCLKITIFKRSFLTSTSQSHTVLQLYFQEV